MKISAICITLSSIACVAPALCAIHVQRDAVSGALVYSNVPPTGPRDALRDKGTQARASVRTSARASATAVGTVAPRRPQDFPVIARSDQQRRDRERHAILNDELDQERQRLARARNAGAAYEVRHRHQSNIDALMREIAALR